MATFLNTILATASATVVSILVTFFLPVSAVAQAAAPAAQPPGWMQFIPIILMVAIFYGLILRPQQKREKLRQGFISQLKRGDEVVTSSGMFGRVEGLTDQFVTLEISDGVRVKMLRSAVMSSVQSLTQNAKGQPATTSGGKA